MEPDFLGRELCKECWNGFHRAVDKPACDVIIDGAKLCQCPCHKPAGQCKHSRNKSAKPEQTSFQVPMMRIGARS